MVQIGELIDIIIFMVILKIIVDAKASIFQQWLEENDLIETINSLQDTIKNIKQKIFGVDRNHQYTFEKEISIDNNFRIIDKLDYDINFIAKYFYLAQTQTNCYSCQKNILVNAIILPEGFESVDEYAMDDLEKQGVDVSDKLIFSRNDYSSILTNITYISPQALERISSFTNERLFQKKYSHSIGCGYYRSICSYCGSSQGDNFIIAEYNSAFYPVNKEDFNKIKLNKINEEIKISAGSSSEGYGHSNDLIRSRNIYKKCIFIKSVFL